MNIGLVPGCDNRYGRYRLCTRMGSRLQTAWCTKPEFIVDTQSQRTSSEESAVISRNPIVGTRLLNRRKKGFGKCCQGERRAGQLS